MAKHKSKDHHRRERPSTPTTLDATINTPNDFTQVKYEPVQHDDHDDVHPSRRPFVPRIPTDCAPATRPERPMTPRKRGAEPPSSALASASKSPRNKVTRYDFASADVALARRAKAKEATINSLTGEEDSSSPGGVSTRAPDMSRSPASTTGKQPFTWGMSPFRSKYDENTASTGKHIMAGLPVRPRPEDSDVREHGTDRTLKSNSSSRVLNSDCRACGSRRHMTKDCHVPSGSGMVSICPFHNRFVLEKMGPVNHHLDGLVAYHPDDTSKAPLYCTLVMSYEMAVRNNDKDRVRYMLPQMFGELVLSRKRKPCCQVVNKEVCAINIAIEFSREFCQGQMPSGLQGVWPYTKRDVKSPAIQEKLRQYDQLGWERMPPGELEAKSWDQIKSEYAKGLIPAQIHRVNGKNLQKYLAIAARLVAVEMEAKENDHHHPEKLKVPIVEKSGGDNSPQHEDTANSQSNLEVLLDEVLRLSAKVDNMALRLKALEARQAGSEPTDMPGSSGHGTHNHPTDIDRDGGSIHWCVQ